MNDYKTKVEFQSGRTLDQSEIGTIILRLSNEDGISDIRIEPDTVQLEYLNHLHSSASVKDALVRAGFPFIAQKKKPGIFKRFIEDLAQQNKKTYGNKRLDCCNTD